MTLVAPRRNEEETSPQAQGGANAAAPAAMGQRPVQQEPASWQEEAGDNNPSRFQPD